MCKIRNSQKIWFWGFEPQKVPTLTQIWYQCSFFLHYWQYWVHWSICFDFFKGKIILFLVSAKKKYSEKSGSDPMDQKSAKMTHKYGFSSWYQNHAHWCVFFSPIYSKIIFFTVLWKQYFVTKESKHANFKKPKKINLN